LRQRFDVTSLDFSRRRQFFKFFSHKKSYFCRHGLTIAPLNAMNGQNPRQIAARILERRRPAANFVEDLLEIALADARLSSADRGLCQELVYGIVRWQAALDWLIARKTGGREQKPASKTCCASASTRFSGSTGFPTTPPSTKPSNSPNTAASARRPDL
jgi:hypothetical protein